VLRVVGGRRVAHSFVQAPEQAPDLLPHADYDFLLGRYVDAATLARATMLAARSGVEPHEVLIAQGWLRQQAYYAALADHLGVPFEPRPDPARLQPPSPKATPRDCLVNGLMRERERARRLVFGPDRMRPGALRQMISQLPPRSVTLASPQSVRRAIYRHFKDLFADQAVGSLLKRHPDKSARLPLSRWQRWTFALSALGLGAVFAAAPAAATVMLSLALGVVFVPIVLLRIAAAFNLARGRVTHAAAPCPRIPDAALPVYTLLVPLYREANVLPALVETLRRLDYPAAKLDIKLILEAVDGETLAAARALDLPGNFETIVVPDLAPRTKPKALNYALPLARGEYLAIYDAEDRPERDQLRRAVDAFRRGAPNLAVVQARLNIYNLHDTWLTRQFTIEYSALFDGLLPTLAGLRLPIPLGGTSNHFRVSALRWLLAWDPYNVTEDADLGIRLTRSGYRCGIITSTTFEEAPVKLNGWLKQRTRWLKGYLVTWLVHMRRPRTLWRELGPRGFAGFHLVIGGTVLAALVHPWVYVLAAFELASGGFLGPPSSLIALPFWVVAWFVLVTGYAGAMALGLSAVRKRGYRELVRQVPFMPLYWLLVSAAAYRGLWQFVRDRFAWEKTEHGLAPPKAAPVNPLAAGVPRLRAHNFRG